MSKNRAKKPAAPQMIVAPPYIRLDLGCGTKKQEGAIGVDIFPFPGVDVVHNLAQAPWPFPDSHANEAYTAHTVEHLTGEERITFFNEVYRVLKPGSKITVITPDWSHACAYGDPTHKWPPMSGWYPFYLKADWRKENAPHCDAAQTKGYGFTCDFDFTPGCSFDEWLHTRSQETKMFAIGHYINSARDLIVTLTSKKKETK